MAVYKIVLSVFLVFRIFTHLLFSIFLTSQNKPVGRQCRYGKQMSKITRNRKTKKRVTKKKKKNLLPAKNSFLPPPHCPIGDFFLLVSEPTDICYSPSQE